MTEPAASNTTPTSDYSDLMTVEENVIGCVGSNKNATMKVPKWIGGIKWCLSIIHKNGPERSSAYAKLKAEQWAASDSEPLWLEVTFVNSGVNCQMPDTGLKVPRQRIEKSTISSLDIVDKGLGHFTKGYSDYTDFEVCAYVRVLRFCSLKPDHFTTLESPHNLVLSVGGTLFYVIKEVLMHYSSVFATMFNGNFAESRAGDEQEPVPIGEIDPQLFNTLLRAIMPGTDRVLPNPETVMGLAELADRFDVSQLRRDCARHLVLCPELTHIERIMLAHRMGMHEVKARLLSLMHRTEMMEFCTNLP